MPISTSDATSNTYNEAPNKNQTNEVSKSNIKTFENEISASKNDNNFFDKNMHKDFSKKIETTPDNELRQAVKDIFGNDLNDQQVDKAISTLKSLNNNNGLSPTTLIGSTDNPNTQKQDPSFNGAFISEGDNGKPTILLGDHLNKQETTATYWEELGHAIDHDLRKDMPEGNADAQGDEGEKLVNWLQGKDINAGNAAKDDNGQVTIDSNTAEAEFSVQYYDPPSTYHEGTFLPGQDDPIAFLELQKFGESSLNLGTQYQVPTGSASEHISVANKNFINISTAMSGIGQDANIAASILEDRDVKLLTEGEKSMLQSAVESFAIGTEQLSKDIIAGTLSTTATVASEELELESAVSQRDVAVISDVASLMFDFESLAEPSTKSIIGTAKDAWALTQEATSRPTFESATGLDNKILHKFGAAREGMDKLHDQLIEYGMEEEANTIKTQAQTLSNVMQAAGEEMLMVSDLQQLYASDGGTIEGNSLGRLDFRSIEDAARTAALAGYDARYNPADDTRFGTGRFYTLKNADNMAQKPSAGFTHLLGDEIQGLKETFYSKQGGNITETQLPADQLFEMFKADSEHDELQYEGRNLYRHKVGSPIENDFSEPSTHYKFDEDLNLVEFRSVRMSKIPPAVGHNYFSDFSNHRGANRPEDADISWVENFTFKPTEFTSDPLALLVQPPEHNEALYRESIINTYDPNIINEMLKGEQKQDDASTALLKNIIA